MERTKKYKLEYLQSLNTEELNSLMLLEVMKLLTIIAYVGIPFLIGLMSYIIYKI
jgi:hypothetical protein